jgi:hypothetical protein
MTKRRHKKPSSADLAVEERRMDQLTADRRLALTVYKAKALGIYCIVALPPGFMKQWVELNEKLEKQRGEN